MLQKKNGDKWNRHIGGYVPVKRSVIYFCKQIGQNTRKRRTQYEKRVRYYYYYYHDGTVNHFDALAGTY